MRNLCYFIDFYQDHQDYFLMKVENGTAVADTNNLQSLTAKSPIRLSWTHYNIIQQELTADGRAWYENEAANEMWSTRTLQRNVSSQYYHRLLQSQDYSIVREKMKALAAPLQDKLEYPQSRREPKGGLYEPSWRKLLLRKGFLDCQSPYAGINGSDCYSMAVTI